MQAESTDTPYEVRCHECRVTFPVGTRRCIHCGERLGRARPRFIPTPHGELPWESEEEEVAGEEAPAGRRRFLSPFTLMWLLAAVAASLYRSCE
jgi:hypothetical protein